MPRHHWRPTPPCDGRMHSKQPAPGEQFLQRSKNKEASKPFFSGVDIELKKERREEC